MGEVVNHVNLDANKPINDLIFKHHYDPITIPKYVLDHPINRHNDLIKKVKDDLPPLIPGLSGNPVKYDGMEGLLPFALSIPHQYAGSLSEEDTKKANRQAVDSAILQAKNQVGLLNAHIEALTKHRESLGEAEEK